MTKVAYKLCLGGIILTRPQGSIGETKLKILAIIHHNNAFHGYGIWRTLKERFHIYLHEQNRRNVYHHLRDLNELGLLMRSQSLNNGNSQIMHTYKLTEKGKALEDKFGIYLTIL